MSIPDKYIEIVNKILDASPNHISVNNGLGIVLDKKYLDLIKLDFINNDTEMDEFLKVLTTELLKNNYVMALLKSRVFYKKEYVENHHFEVQNAISSLDILIWDEGRHLAYDYDALNDPDIKDFIDILKKN